MSYLAVLCGLSLLLLSWPVSARLTVEQVGPVIIDEKQGFAEVVLLRLSMPWKMSPQGELGPIVQIEEADSRIYTGHGGSTRLPRRLILPGGNATIELRSVAPFAGEGEDDMDGAKLVFTHRGKRLTHGVRQWQDVNRNGFTDWFEARVNRILKTAGASANFELSDTASAVSNWHQTEDVDCGGVLPRLPTVLLLSPVCVNSLGLNVHRLDLDRELTATVLHEARHAWSYRQLRQRRGEGGITAVYGAMLNCVFHGGGHCGGGARPDAAFMAGQEEEAERFAQKHKAFAER